MATLYTLRHVNRTWLLVELETGEIVDHFQDYKLALEMLSEQNDSDL